MLGAGGFSSWHCFGLRVECVAMASAHQPGEEWHTQACGFQNTGYKFVSTYKKGSKGKYQLVVSGKS